MNLISIGGRIGTGDDAYGNLNLFTYKDRNQSYVYLHLSSSSLSLISGISLLSKMISCT